jgi:hypothetical protein
LSASSVAAIERWREAMQGLDEWSLPGIIADAWSDGDNDDRRWIDQYLDRSRRQAIENDNQDQAIYDIELCERSLRPLSR